jgi:predicted nucleotidyltransferase component of viral defense system
MSTRILSRDTLARINRTTLQYPLAVAEKDYFLALVSQIIHNSPLKDRIIFKGGTALHHCYLEQSRFSEDLDFGSLDKTITADEVRSVIEASDFLTVKKVFVSTATIKLEKVQYSGLLDTPGSLKVEIDYLQDVVLPPRDLPYRNAWGIETTVRVMDLREICAEKIRAMSDRARHRDFYDLFMILKNHSIDLTEITALIKRKEIRSPISQAKMLANLETTQGDREHELQTVRYAEPADDRALAAMIEQLPFTVIEKE